MTNYTKAITAFLTSLVSMVAIFGFDISGYLNEGVISAIAIGLNTVLVWLLPNKS